MKNKLKYLFFGLLTFFSLSSITYGYTFNNYSQYLRTNLNSWPLRSYYRWPWYQWFSCSIYSSSWNPIWDKEVSGVSDSYKCGAIFWHNQNTFITPMMVKVGNVYDVFYYFYWSEKEQSGNKYLIRTQTLNVPKNGLLNFFWYGESKQYDQFLPNKFWYTLIDSQIAGTMKIMTSAGGKNFFWMYMTMEGNDFIVYDIEKWRKYIWHAPFDFQYERIRWGYDIPDLIKTTAPNVIYEAEYSTTQGVNIFDQPIEMARNENDLWQELFLWFTLWKLLKADLVDIWEWPKLSTNTNSTGSNWGLYKQQLEEYNQCISYHTNLKIYTTYDRECYRSLADDPTQNIDQWKSISDWNWEVELEGITDLVCKNFLSRKKAYKEKRANKWSDFLKDSQDNWLAPNFINPQAICWEKPKEIIKEDKNILENAWDWFRGRRGEPAMTTEDWEKLYAVDFDPDFTSLRSLYWQCQGLDRFWITKNFTQTPEEKSKACSDYATKKAEMLKKWQWANLWDFYWKTVTWAIAKIEKKKNQDWLIKTFWNEVKESLSEGGEALLNAVQAPFNSWYNSVLPLQCSSTHRHIEIMDYFLWGLFAIVAFILFKFF